MKILLTGGHAGSTAYAFIQELKKQKNEKWEILWVGSRSAIEGKNIPTYEKMVFPKIGVKYYPIFTGRLQRKFTLWTLLSIFKIPFGFIHAISLVAKINPNIVLSFGGFASYPVVIAAKIFRIPMILHEQTQEVGRANRYAGKLVDKIALARESSKKYFSKDKCVVVGNPVSSEMLSIKIKKKLSKPPVVLITGGSRGSTPINSLIEKSLETLLTRYKLIHQTGFVEYDKFEKVKKKLPSNLKKRYEIFPFKEPWNWNKYIQKADLVISRSGANTVSELMIAKKPTIFIPLPFAYLDEQRKNAEYAQKFGIAYIFDQKKQNAEDLLKLIEKVIKNWNKIIKRVENKKSPDENASKNLYRLVRAHIPSFRA